MFYSIAIVEISFIVFRYQIFHNTIMFEFQEKYAIFYWPYNNAYNCIFLKFEHITYLGIPFHYPISTVFQLNVIISDEIIFPQRKIIYFRVFIFYKTILHIPLLLEWNVKNKYCPRWDSKPSGAFVGKYFQGIFIFASVLFVLYREALVV